MTSPFSTGDWVTEKQNKVRQRWQELLASKRENDMTITLTETEYKVDEEGFADFTALEEHWGHLQRMLAEKAKLQAGIDKVEAFFAAEMARAGATGLSIGGVRRVVYKRNATFPKSKYAEANPHVYAAYQKQTTVFDWEAFKRDRPEEVKQWQGFSFKYVAAKNG